MHVTFAPPLVKVHQMALKQVVQIAPLVDFMKMANVRIVYLVITNPKLANPSVCLVQYVNIIHIQRKVNVTDRAMGKYQSQTTQIKCDECTSNHVSFPCNHE